MISKTKIEKKISRKTNIKLKNLIIKLKKLGNLEIANLLAMPKRKAIAVNIEELNKETKPGDRVIVPGKVLGKGKIEHSITIAAYSFSQSARKKLSLCKFAEIEELAKEKSVKIIH